MKLPNFIQRFVSPKSNFGKIKTVTVENDFTGETGIESISDSQNLEQYKMSLYLFIGVNLIARRVAGVPFDLYKIKRQNGEFEEVVTHDMLNLLHNPNPRQTRKEVWELTTMFYLLAGEAFWYLERPTAGSKKVIAVHPLRPDYIYIVLSEDKKTIIGYEYNAHNGEKIRIAPEDILHFKNVDPTNTARGVGVVRPASSRIITEREASSYQANFFKNQGRPDMAIFVDTEITSEDAEQARQKWREVYGGEGGKAGFFGNDVKSVQELNKTPKEMDFINSQNFLRDDILASLGVPKAMITSDDVNLANAKQANIMFLENAVVPVVDMFKDVLNNKLLSTVDETLFVDYDSPVPEDRELKLKEVTQLTGKVMTQNEARALYGLDSVDGADVLAPVAFGPAQMSVVQESARSIVKTRPMLQKRLAMVEALAELDVAVQMSDTTPERSMNSIFNTKSARADFADAYNKNVDDESAKAEKEVNKYFDGMYKRIMEKNETGFSASGFMDLTEEKIIAKNDLGGYFKVLYAKTGQEVLDALFQPEKTIGDGETFEFTAQEEAEYNKRAEFFAGSIVDSAFDVVKSTVEQGISNGDGVEKIGRELRASFEDMKVWKGKQIARTETGFAMSQATDNAYKQSTVVTGKEWITAGDANVRPDHQANAGVIVGKNEVFPSGEKYPAEHSINCRCVLAPAV